MKILGLVVDVRLKYKEHISNVATSGLEAAMKLKRSKGLSTATARQLFTAMVAPVVNYASNVVAACLRLQDGKTARSSAENRCLRSHRSIPHCCNQRRRG